MSLGETLELELRTALKAKDALRVSVIRRIRNAVKNREIEIRERLDDDGIIAVISSLVKQTKESIRAFEEGKRSDLVAKESSELEILTSFLPQPLSEDEIVQRIDAAIADLQAASPADLGRVMKAIMPELRGRSDGSRVNELVKERLTSIAGSEGTS